MDFNLICSQIQKLLIINERVVLPHTGELVVETTPASFLEDGKTILPPGKKLLFRQGVEEGNFEQWQEELSGRIREELQADGISQVPGLGIFKDEGEGVISFSVAPEFDFAPDSFSLEAISLEVNEPVCQEQNAVEEVAVEEGKGGEAQNVPQAQEVIVVEETKVEQEPKVPQTPQPPEEKVAPAIEKEKKAPQSMEQKRKVQKWVVWSAVVVILLLVLVLFVILFKEDFMELLKRLLYTKEELEIMQKWAAQ